MVDYKSRSIGSETKTLNEGNAVNVVIVIFGVAMKNTLISEGNAYWQCGMGKETANMIVFTVFNFHSYVLLASFTHSKMLKSPMRSNLIRLGFSA
ncbi:hypothetical protein [Serratia sp. JSRIV006]|uniref:hypothetical protein n=1 Tax=Serratia sp. JSRIV006 TaxID=2831896 RepID=UPI001CC12A9C|nr:hypothetical protein [Serratia sp. JSRIV006]UAN61353.1 hypothetical protein KGP16_17245 [Serratia sp. JSRIV006]